MTTTITRPTSVEAEDVPRPIRRSRLRLRGVTASEVLAVVGSAVGALGLTWVLYERVLPLSGVLGFWVFWYVVFLIMYAATVGMTAGNGRAVADRLVSTVMTSAAVFVLVVIINQVAYTIYRGWPALRHAGNFFTQTMGDTGPLQGLNVGGAFHAMIGSLEQMGIATAISVPLGLLAALFLAEVGGPLARPIRAIVEAMTALPEIIAGLFIYAVWILTFGLGQSGFAASLALSVMMIPYVTRSSEVMLRLVPGGLREASLALGASQWRTAWLVVLPTARPSLTTAVVLAMARAIGETAPVLLTAGFTPFLNANPFHNPQASLPLYIFSYERLPQGAFVSRAFGAALVLMLVVAILFITARVLGGRQPGRSSGRQRRQAAREAWDARERARKNGAN
jgi:phosphate transport system permease protein